jgi:hypothetical protein
MSMGKDGESGEVWHTSELGVLLGRGIASPRQDLAIPHPAMAHNFIFTKSSQTSEFQELPVRNVRMLSQSQPGEVCYLRLNSVCLEAAGSLLLIEN